MPRRDKKIRMDHEGPHRVPFEKARRKIIMTQDVCAICGRIVDKSIKAPDPMSPSVDHIIPIARGGHPSDPANLQLTHRICNSRKGTKINVATAPPKQKILNSMDWANF